jgi:hypothetical protein
MPHSPPPYLNDLAPPAPLLSATIPAIEADLRLQTLVPHNIHRLLADRSVRSIRPHPILPSYLAH